MDDFEKVEALSIIASYYENQFKNDYARKNRISYTNKTYNDLKEDLQKAGSWKQYFLYEDAKDNIQDLRKKNSDKYTNSSQKTEANKKGIAQYLSGIQDLTDVQRQAIWQGYYTSETYKEVANRYGY